MKITNLVAYEILDCQGLPTLECTLTLDHKYVVKASIPNGISCGKNEAHILVDKEFRYHGLGMQKAATLINTVIKKMLLLKDPDLQKIDALLLDYDGTAQKTVLGANSMLCVSIAVARAQALALECLLHQLLASLFFNTPKKNTLRLCFNVFNGGMHALKSIDIQEIMLVMPPILLSEQLELGLHSLAELKKNLFKKNIFFAQGAEGGIAAPLQTKAALDIVATHIQDILQQTGIQITMALDLAASHLFDTQTHSYHLLNQNLSSKELYAWYQTIIKEYPITFIEDPFDASDHAWWKKLNQETNHSFVVGDDLYTTDARIITDPLLTECAQGVIIKPNQRGTISETIEAVKATYAHQKTVVASHRSRETCDSFLADLAIAIDASFIKAGCLGSERMAKYNRLIKISS